MIRFFDIILSLLGLILLTPFFIITALCIVFTSRGGVFYAQKRVGQFGKEFTLFKFRTMHKGADKKNLLTVGTRDERINKVGHFLRQYKLDELPQLWNVLKGDMSLVGPRPEVRKYVDLYNDEQKRVLNVRPGITDYASIAYKNENNILAQSENPEKQYVEKIMPEKLQLNLLFIVNQSVKEYFKILFLTVKIIF
ncbi:MAG: sugar transferase [Lentimicrobiaceae bacterium]|nr:sugar transferase [Lentimicrobiaceae bacterium]